MKMHYIFVMHVPQVLTFQRACEQIFVGKEFRWTQELFNLIVRKLLFQLYFFFDAQSIHVLWIKVASMQSAWIQPTW